MQCLPSLKTASTDHMYDFYFTTSIIQSKIVGIVTGKIKWSKKEKTNNKTDPSREWENKSQTESKYLQKIQLIQDYDPKYIKNS